MLWTSKFSDKDRICIILPCWASRSGKGRSEENHTPTITHLPLAQPQGRALRASQVAVGLEFI